MAWVVCCFRLSQSNSSTSSCRRHSMSEVLPMTLMPSLSRTLPQAGADSPAVVDRGVWRGAAGLTILVLAGFGFLYSLAGVGVGQALFPSPANGSVVKRGGPVIGPE